MSKSLRLPKRHLQVVNRQAGLVGHRVLAVGRIRPADCANCGNARRIQARNEAGQLHTVHCPVCQLSAIGTAAVTR